MDGVPTETVKPALQGWQKTLAVKKVTFVIQHLRAGGAEKQVLLTARYLSERSCHCQVFTLGNWPAQPRIAELIHSAQRAGVEVLRPAGHGMFFPQQVLHLRRFVRKNEGVVLWSWGRRADVVCKVLAGGSPRERLICALASAHGGKIEKYRAVERFLHTRVSLYISNSWKNCELLSRVVPGVMQRSRVIYNGLEEDEFNQPPASLPPQPDKLRVVLLGNIRFEIKGYDLVLELAKRIAQERLPIEIQIAGRGDEEERLLSAIRTHQLERVIRYFGEVSKPYDFLRQGNVFLLMSRVEGVPNALLEAMNVGLPCVSTRVGDVDRFATDGRNIRIVEIGDVSGALGVLKEMIVSWPKACRMGEEARQLCRQRFTLRQLGEATGEAIASLFGGEP